jgi:hypothetical protein
MILRFSLADCYGLKREAPFKNSTKIFVECDYLVYRNLKAL